LLIQCTHDFAGANESMLAFALQPCIYVEPSKQVINMHVNKQHQQPKVSYVVACEPDIIILK
jgi:hypothetical protein